MVDFEVIKNESVKDLRVTEDNLLEASMSSALISTKYLSWHMDYNRYYQSIIKEKDKLKLLLNLYYTGKATADQITAVGMSKPFTLKIDKVADIDMFIVSNHKYVEIDNLINEVKEQLRYIESVLDSLKFRHIVIKNTIDWKRFQNGC